MTTTPAHRHRSLLFLGALVAGALLVGCGGDDGDGSAQEGKTPAEIAREGREPDASANGDESDDEGSTESFERVGTLEFFMPEEVEAPAGYTTLPNACESDDDEPYGAYIRYAVPDGWERSGRGSSGSGGDLTGSVDHQFNTADGQVWISLDRDRRDEQDRVIGDGDEPTESFDYVYSRGDDETRVVHSEAFTVSIDGDDHQVWTVTDRSDLHAGENAVYRVRMIAFHMTWPADGSSTTSFVMELIGDPAALDEDTVRTIVETVQVPECVRHQVVITNEVSVSTDLDGDGHVSTTDDLREVLGL